MRGIFHILLAELLDFGAGQSTLNVTEEKHLVGCYDCQDELESCIALYAKAAARSGEAA